MDIFDELAREAGIDPDSPEEKLGYALALADDDLLERLVQLRRAKGLTQEAVAARMKRNKSAVSRFENLGADPTLSMIRRYARAVGLMIHHTVADTEVEASAEVENAKLKTRYFAEAAPRVHQRDDRARPLGTFREIGLVSS